MSPPPQTAPHQSEIMIRADGLGKKFKIYHRPTDRLAEWVTGGRVTKHADFWAVRGVSFEVPRGSCLGVIGANGSGKSTLLKMLTGALHPTEGSFEIRGRVLSLIELGTGLNPLMSGRANIVNAARLLGFPVEYARDQIGAIEAFAELGDFFDRDVRVYSTGMRVRLAFSMFACFKPEVFMVDEALSVGDVFFQQKCAARLRDLLDAGMTMLFVSHDQGAVLNLCDRAILLDHGRPVFDGEPGDTLARYTAGVRGKPKYGPRKPKASEAKPAPVAPRQSAAPPDEAAQVLAHDVIRDAAHQRFGTGDLLVLAVRVTDSGGHDAMHAFMGQPLSFHILIEARRPIDQPRVGIKLLDRFTNLLFACGTRMLGHELPAMEAGERLVVRLEVTMDLAPGQYTLSVGASTPKDEDPESGVVHDEVPDLGPLKILLDKAKPRPFFGAARLNVSASHASCPGLAPASAPHTVP